MPWKRTVSGPSTKTKGNSRDKSHSGGSESSVSGQNIVYVVSLAFASWCVLALMMEFAKNVNPRLR